MRSKNAPRSHQDAPGRSQNAPRRAQDAPKTPQDIPKLRPKRPKTRPRRPKTAPRGAQNDPRRPKTQEQKAFRKRSEAQSLPDLDFGAFWGGFWTVLGWILDRFRMDFGSFWGCFWRLLGRFSKKLGLALRCKFVPNGCHIELLKTPQGDPKRP